MDADNNIDFSLSLSLSRHILVCTIAELENTSHTLHIKNQQIKMEKTHHLILIIRILLLITM